MRHPQYVGFVLIMFGFLVQWPTLVTLVMFPILVTMYFLLAKREEREAEVEFGQAWRDYRSEDATLCSAIQQAERELLALGQ